jgi:hypothetical protein
MPIASNLPETDSVPRTIHMDDKKFSLHPELSNKVNSSAMGVGKLRPRNWNFNIIFIILIVGLSISVVSL